MLKLESASMIFKTFLFIFWFLFKSSSLAAEVNKNDLFINADLLNIDRQENMAVFSGQVILWFEDTVLETDKVIIKYKNNQQQKSIDNISVPNKLSAYRQSTEEVLLADRAQYIHDKAQLTFYGNVILEHQQKILKTTQLIYHTKLITSNKFNLDK